MENRENHRSKMNPPTVYGLDFTRKQIDQAVASGKLLSIDLEFTRKCNLRCKYCYANGGTPLRNELSLKEIKNIIDQAIKLGTETFSLVGGGEPFLYKHLFEVINYVQNKGKKVIVFTNATLIDSNTAVRLYSKRVSVVAKLNSLSEGVQDSLTGKGSYKKIHKGIFNLLNAGYPGKSQMGIETIICKQNIKEIPNLWLWARSRNIIPYFETITMQGRAKKNDISVSKSSLRKIFNNICEMDKNFGYEWIPKPPLMGFSCQRNFYSILIKSNGNIQPCTGIEHLVGNIRDITLRKALKNQTVRQLRDIKNTIKGKCKKCEHIDCYGCRGNAYNVNNDCLSEDPICWIK